MIKRLLLKHKDNIVFCVSHTTRPPRNGEIDGISYHFVNEDTFLEVLITITIIDDIKRWIYGI